MYELIMYDLETGDRWMHAFVRIEKAFQEFGFLVKMAELGGAFASFTLVAPNGDVLGVY